MILKYGSLALILSRLKWVARISTGFVESAVNYVVAKRFTKRQQMQWSPKGAHLLLQMRTRVLNGELEQMFRNWYPGFRAANDEKIKKVA
jgi:hypothetical protein